MFFSNFKSNNILVKCVEIVQNLCYSLSMERIKLVVQYNGKDFCGWQVQPNKRTVEGELEKVPFRGEKIDGRKATPGGDQSADDPLP